MASNLGRMSSAHSLYCQDEEEHKNAESIKPYEMLDIETWRSAVTDSAFRSSCDALLLLWDKTKGQETSKGGGKEEATLHDFALVAYISELIFESCGDSMMA